MKSHPQQLHSSTGFSMIEALIALVVLSVGMVSLAKFEINLLNSGSLSKTRSIAVKLAQQKMEMLRNNITIDDFDNLAVLTTPDFIDDPDYTDGIIAATNATFHRSYKLENGPVANSKKVAVKVSWVDAKDGTQNVELNSMISWDDPKSSVRLAHAGSSGLSGPGGSVSTPGPTPEPDPEVTSYNASIVGIVSFNGNQSKNWTVSINGSSCATGLDAGSYNCALNNLVGSHTFTLSISSTGSTCGTDSVSKTVSEASVTATQNFSHAKNSGSCS